MTDIFTPPTDNLYKFMAVSGIVLVLAGVIAPPLFFLQAGMEYIAQRRGSDELRAHEEFVAQRLKTLELREQRARDEKINLQQRLEGLNSVSNSSEVDKVQGLIKEVNRELESIADSSDELTLNLALKRAQIKYEDTVSTNRRFLSRLFLLIGFVAGLVGVFISFVGFRRWYKRLQQFQDRVTAKEAEDKLAVTAAREQIKKTSPKQSPPPQAEPEPSK